MLVVTGCVDATGFELLATAPVEAFGDALGEALATGVVLGDWLGDSLGVSDGLGEAVSLFDAVSFFGATDATWPLSEPPSAMADTAHAEHNTIAVIPYA